MALLAKIASSLLAIGLCGMLGTIGAHVGLGVGFTALWLFAPMAFAGLILIGVEFLIHVWSGP